MVTRRNFMKKVGLASSGGLLAAFASQLWVRAEGPATVPRRFVTLVHHNGWWRKLLRPDNMHLPAAQWVMPEALEPLAHLREQMTLLESMYNPHGKGFHGTYGGAILGVVPGYGDPKLGFGGITIDRFIATELDAGTPFSSVNLGHPLDSTRPAANASADGPGAVYPSMSNPSQIIANLFAGGSQVDQEAAQRAIEQKLSVLDASVEDIERMRARLAGPEKAQMDQYLASIRELELQLEAITEIDCSAPAMPEGWPQPANQVVSEALCDFYYHAGALALECGLTNVLTIAWEGVGNEPMQPKYNFEPVNADGDSLHAHISHPMEEAYLDNDSDEGWAAVEDRVAIVRRIYNWRSRQVATFFDRLAANDLGGYSLADRTLLMWLNAAGDRHHNGHDNQQLMFLGNPDGVLNTGRYERFDPMDHCISDAFVTAACAMGVETEVFGDPDHCKGPLPGSLA